VETRRQCGRCEDWPSSDATNKAAVSLSLRRAALQRPPSCHCAEVACSHCVTIDAAGPLLGAAPTRRNASATLKPSRNSYLDIINFFGGHNSKGEEQR
jgi:hypothetical protein